MFDKFETDFSSVANFEFDSDLIEFISGTLKTKMSLLEHDYANDYSSDSGFAYNVAKAEFVGGLVRQKDQRPANATFHATYNSSIDGIWGAGVLTGTATGGASVIGGKLDLTGGTQKYVNYSAVGNASSQQEGCIRFKYTPNYSGVPSSDMHFFCISKDTTLDYNSINLRHSVAGYIFIRVCDQNGNYIIPNAQDYYWTPTNGTEYEIEMDWNLTLGQTRIFINGIQVGPTKTGAGIRSSNIGNLRIGAFNNAGSIVSNFKIDDVMIFSTVQHTANYTPVDYSLPNLYAETKVDLPPHQNVIELQDYISLTATDTANCKYIIHGKYWNGASWVASNGSYAQASTKALINSNLFTLAVLVPQPTINMSVVFPDDTVQNYVSYSNLLHHGIIYPTIAKAKVKEDLYFNILDDIKKYSTEVSGTSLKLKIMKSDIEYFWTGSAWEESTTDSENNTLEEIKTYFDSLEVLEGDKLNIEIIFISDGYHTVTITGLDLYFAYKYLYCTINDVTNLAIISGDTTWTGSSNSLKYKYLLEATNKIFDYIGQEKDDDRFYLYDNYKLKKACKLQSLFQCRNAQALRMQELVKIKTGSILSEGRLSVSRNAHEQYDTMALSILKKLLADYEICQGTGRG